MNHVFALLVIILTLSLTLSKREIEFSPVKITTFKQSNEKLNSNSKLSQSNIRRALFAHQRTTECCEKNMKCCEARKRDCADEKTIQVKAVMVRCPGAKKELERNIKYKVESTREKDLKSFQGYDQNEMVTRSKIKNCKRKVVITMKLGSVVFKKDQFIIIDHVFDPITDRPQRLLNPYIIKMQETLIRQIYPLKYVNYVNSKSYEVVYNKEDGNYTGCHTSGSHPTCGLMTYNGKVIPYSEGFCCSCDSLKNAQNQPKANMPEDEALISYSDPGHLLDGVECGSDVKLKSDECATIKTNQAQSANCDDKQRRENCNFTAEDEFKSNVLGTGADCQNFFKEKPSTERTVICNDPHDKDADFGTHQILSGGIQIRGGQNCADRYTPPNLDPELYHESTHCLKFSDVWYAIYKLQKPSLDHAVSLHIYQKRQSIGGKTLWCDLTDGQNIHLNLSAEATCGVEPNLKLALHYILDNANPKFALNYQTQRILIPECSKSDPSESPELNGGPGEYLVIRHDQVNVDGDQCNIPGVGFEGFYNQPNRCGNPRGSCLANQPKDLWLHEKQAEAHNCKGCFFLKNYAYVPKNALIKNDEDKDDVKLELMYNGDIHSTIEIEINADDNMVLRPNAAAMITEVYIDSTMAHKTLITVKVTNSGLVSSKFLTKLNDCPEDVPSSFNSIKSDMVTIPPQHQHIFTLKIECKLPSDVFFCSAEVLNAKMELIALRRIKIQKSDRCICSWYCLCACIASTTGLKCKAMSLEHYHAAGFQGSLPISSTLVTNRAVIELSETFFIILFLILTLLLLGLAKALVGCCCCIPVGFWGLDIIFDLPKPMSRYYESELRGMPVMYDAQGWPIDPNTKKRVRNISKPCEFCMNVIFFFIFPIAVLIRLIRKCCCPYGFGAVPCECKTNLSPDFVCYADDDLCPCEDEQYIRCSKSFLMEEEENEEGEKGGEDEKEEEAVYVAAYAMQQYRSHDEGETETTEEVEEETEEVEET